MAIYEYTGTSACMVGQLKASAWVDASMDQSSASLWTSKLQKTTTLRTRFSENTRLQFLDKKHHFSRKHFAKTTDRRISLV